MGHRKTTFFEKVLRIFSLSLKIRSFRFFFLTQKYNVCVCDSLMNDKVILALKYFFVSLDLEWKKQKKNIMRMQKNI